jgi:hypothetical protein
MGKIVGYVLDGSTGKVIPANTKEFDRYATYIDARIAKYKKDIANAANVFEEADIRRAFRAETMSSMVTKVQKCSEKLVVRPESSTFLGDRAAFRNVPVDTFLYLDPIQNLATELKQMVAESNDAVREKLRYDLHISWGTFFCRAVSMLVKKRLANMDNTKSTTTPESGSKSSTNFASVSSPGPAEHLHEKLSLITNLLSEINTSLSDSQALDASTSILNSSPSTESTKDHPNTSIQDILHTTRPLRELSNKIEDTIGKGHTFFSPSKK